jgi:phosphomevalonate kinase
VRLDDAETPEGDAAAASAAWRTTGAGGGRLVVDSRALLVGERKLGLGRSAATLVAAVAALAGSAAPDAVLPQALAANALLQDGRGSGADVAAAVHGGVIEVRRAAGGLAVVRRRLPDGLYLLAGWTRTAAATRSLLARFGTPPAAAAPVLADLGAVAAAAADAVARGDGQALLAAVDRTTPLLEALGVEAGVPIVTPALRALVAAARRAGAVAKPSGAGGGDCGIALATSARVAAAVRAAWQEAGIVPLEVAVAPVGVGLG